VREVGSQPHPRLDRPHLGIAIVSGQHQPGDVLNNEIDASEQLHVSRSAYREAIRILAAKGWWRAGPRPAPGSPALALEPAGPRGPGLVLRVRAQRGLPSPALRTADDRRARRRGLAAERRDDAQLERMRAALVQMQSETLATEAGQAADRDFHDTVLEATGNAPLFTLSSSIGAAVRWTTIFKQRERQLPRDPMPDHWKVFDAIAAGRRTRPARRWSGWWAWRWTTPARRWGGPRSPPRPWARFHFRLGRLDRD
jgi:hypothetical protein